MHACQTADSLIGIGITGRVGVFWNTPDSLYGRVGGHILLHQIHIRTICGHRNVDHLDTKIFSNGEMSVISRYRAQEFNLVKLAPRGISHNAMSHRTGDGVVHYVQAGVSIDNDIVSRNLDHIR